MSISFLIAMFLIARGGGVQAAYNKNNTSNKDGVVYSLRGARGTGLLFGAQFMFCVSQSFKGW